MSGKPVSMRTVVAVLVIAALGVVATVLLRDVREQTSTLGSLEYRPPVATEVDLSAQKKTVGQTLYVPVYSHIYSEGGRPLLLETTVSIRNIDPSHAITLVSLEYYGTDGKLIREFLRNPVLLGSLATAEYLVEKREISGGSGANFVLEWHAEDRAIPPLVEAVMVGNEQQRSLAFTSRARVISQEDWVDAVVDEMPDRSDEEK